MNFVVRMKATVHKDDDVNWERMYDNMRKGRPVQETQARELHRLAGVQEGPCKVGELEEFQRVPSPKYQI